MNPENTCIAFDIGACLVRLDYASFMAAGGRAGNRSAEAFEQDYNNANLELLSMGGEITDHEFRVGLRDVINPQISLREADEVIKHAWPGQIDELVQLKEDLHNTGYPVGILSNISAGGVRLLSEMYPAVFETFDEKSPKAYSFDLQSIKPDPSVYSPFEKYPHVIFIDDKPSYLQIGLDLGWDGILYTGHIDENEVIRKLHGETAVPPGAIGAKNVNEVIAALEQFGVRLD